MTDNPIGELSITHPQAKFVEYVAERGEILWNWNSDTVQSRPDVRTMIVDLINKQILREIEYVTDASQVSGRNFLKLTERGAAVADRIASAKSKTSKIIAG